MEAQFLEAAELIQENRSALAAQLELERAFGARGVDRSGQPRSPVRFAGGCSTSVEVTEGAKVVATGITELPSGLSAQFAMPADKDGHWELNDDAGDDLNRTWDIEEEFETKWHQEAEQHVIADGASVQAEEAPRGSTVQMMAKTPDMDVSEWIELSAKRALAAADAMDQRVQMSLEKAEASDRKFDEYRHHLEKLWETGDHQDYKQRLEPMWGVRSVQANQLEEGLVTAEGR
jgi:hypothetical protein